MESSEKIGFDYDGSSLIFDNSENAHMCSEEEMFTDNIDLILSNGESTIVGNDFITKVVVVVSWSCTSDKRKIYTKIFNNVIYFTDSPVNIISVTALAESMNY